jgi:co-chaperonin GroES (HSP10)
MSNHYRRQCALGVPWCHVASRDGRAHSRLYDTDSDTDTGSSNSNSNTIATSSGVVIASMGLKNDLPCQGRVVKVGPGRMGPDGTYTPSPVAPGDYVKFKDYAGNDVVIEGKPYTVVKMVDLLSTYTGE